ncbi:hypothetical protein [Actinomadura sp. 21ATH]|uniref:hypothetical protein n=1 Tax=Actinomadura sp. 21ATH TaxID=1735444 RepID=UPI0035C22925
MTAVAGAAYTAAQYNQNTRDNLMETGPAKATAAGRLLVTGGANSLVEREITQQNVATSQTTGSTSFTDLTTVGPVSTAATGPIALVWFAAQMSNSGATAVTQCAVDVSGATTRAPETTADLYIDGLGANQAIRASTVHLFSGLTPGTQSFKLQYRVGSGTGTFYDRSVGVMAL